MATTFKLQLGLKRKDDNEPVRFKIDGGRFDSEKTLKLNVDTPYLLELRLTQEIEVLDLAIQGSSISLNEGKSGKAGESLYTCEWTSTSFSPNKKGNRQQIIIIIRLKVSGVIVELKTTLQCKLYKEEEKTHCKWGDLANFLEYDCKIPDGATYVDVTKQVIR
ncbi:DgyrCDS8448 [Dimorphilus gyrociliatus]|uniref:CB1 cannabinoid receptor-interacting protein 1 n=1 Tax=Dimorphilus gyrociliatus TaxID=2664684 RepID=A0A7I8VZA7_9ANNE|nr:DgyrCDS8448 [Dimorphilus gyrociliatus]